MEQIEQDRQNWTTLTKLDKKEKKKIALKRNENKYIIARDNTSRG